MIREDLENYVVKVLAETLSKEELPIKLAFFKHLWNNNLIDQERILKGCINHYYDSQYKINNCHAKNTTYDTAIQFDVSVSTVQNVIYKFRHVVLKF